MAGIFREKSLNKVTSPEQLDDYIKVTTPSVWFILFALLLVIVGAVVWGIFGEITVDTGSGVETLAPIKYILG